MRGTKFLIVFVFGLLGLSDCCAQIIVTELFPTRKDSLYDYQIYQRYYWWPYFPGLCGYIWRFSQLDEQLLGKFVALGYLPQLYYCNCPTKFSNYTNAPYNSLYLPNKNTKYIFEAKNSGSGINNEIYEGNLPIPTKENSVDRIVYEINKVKNNKDERQSDIHQSTTTIGKSGETIQIIEIISTQLNVLVKQPAKGKKISIDKIQGKDQLKSEITEKSTGNMESISEKIKKDFQLSSGTRKVYVVNKPKRTNGWENFKGIYTRSSQNNKNQDNEKKYNNNTQRSYSSGPGDNMQRNNTPQISKKVSNVSHLKTRVFE